ncbi:MAG: methionyl-tRNA formyltransferase [Peptococcaceae bacterium]|nr:methionyl-tRNA formyltransferase [Peptococcaceae bacterium]
MNVVFMGTPDFAVPSLEALAGAGLDIKAVVTQPDRPRGRGKKVLPSPVKEKALELELPVYQPERIREESFIALLRGLDPDVVAVVAFGQILPGEIIDLPPLGCINVHASLLPRYRGAAPIQRAIMNGETETGVTTMRMDRGLDTGDMLLQARTPIDPDENFGSVHNRLSRMGADLLAETLELLAAGKLAGFPQDHEKATYAPPIRREDEIIDWRRPAREVKNQVRGLDPLPGARTWLGEKVLKIWRVSGPDRTIPAFGAGGQAGGSLPGEITVISGEGPVVQCGDYPLVVRELQLEGGRRMAAAEFLRGVKVAPGIVLGRV